MQDLHVNKKLFDSIIEPNFVPLAPKLQPRESFKDFKPEFRIYVNRKSGFFFAALHVTLMNLKFQTLTFEIGGLWEKKRVSNHKLIPIYMC